MSSRAPRRALLMPLRLRRVRSNYSQTDFPQPCGLKIRSVDAGYLASFSAGRRGRLTSSPPQLGQMPLRTVVAQSTQNVHSNVQMSASGDSGGRPRSQHSQLGRSWSMSIPFTAPGRLRHSFGRPGQTLLGLRPDSAPLVGCRDRLSFQTTLLGVDASECFPDEGVRCAANVPNEPRAAAT